MGVGMAGGEGGQHLGDPNAALLGWGEGPPPSLPLPRGLASFLLFSYPSSLNTHIIYNIGLSLSLSHLSLYQTLYLYSRTQNSIISFLSANGGGWGLSPWYQPPGAQRREHGGGDEDGMG